MSGTPADACRCGHPMAHHLSTYFGGGACDDCGCAAFRPAPPHAPGHRDDCECTRCGGEVGASA